MVIVCDKVSVGAFDADNDEAKQNSEEISQDSVLSVDAAVESELIGICFAQVEPERVHKFSLFLCEEAFEHCNANSASLF